MLNHFLNECLFYSSGLSAQISSWIKGEIDAKIETNGATLFANIFADPSILVGIFLKIFHYQVLRLCHKNVLERVNLEGKS